MSRTLREFKGIEYRDKVCTIFKRRKDKKHFVFRGDGWSTKARGGIGNKAGWKMPIPKWLFIIYKERNYDYSKW